MTFDFHPEAKTEFLEAIDYYETAHRGLEKISLQTLNVHYE